MKKEIIFVLHTLSIGGAERRVSTLANYIAEKGFDVTFLLIDDGTVSFMLDERIKIVCVNQGKSPADYPETRCEFLRLPSAPSVSVKEKVQLFLRKKAGAGKAELTETELFLKCSYAEPLRYYIKEHPEAIVVSFMTIPNISAMMALKGLPNRAVISDCTSAEFEYPPESPYCELRRKYYPRAQAGMFQTPDERDYYTFLPKVNKYVIPNFIRGEILPERFEGIRRKDIVNFCRLSAAKDLPLLIDAFSLFHKDHPEYTLSIYGEGELKDSLLAQISDLGLSEAASIYPFDKEVHKVIRDAAMFVSSSYREGISNSMLEAMGTGLPCVCTDCPAGGAKMMIEDHENGLLVPVRDADALYRAMKEVAEDPLLSEKLAKNAVKIKERLKPEKICDEMLAAILGDRKDTI